MAQQWTSQIRNARNASEQISTLRSLKNELIGHPGNKVKAIASGILDPIVRLISNRPARQDGKSHDYSFASKPLTEEDVVRLQGLHVVASLAMGGPSFLSRFQSASALPAILSNLCPLYNPPQLVLASLRALSNLADSCALAPTTSTLSTSILAEGLFIRQHLSSLCRIILQSSPSITVQCQISTAASLISRVCREERHQQSLASLGVLDALATKLASFAVAGGFVIPGAEILSQKEGLHEFFPAPAPQNAVLAVILEAISVVIADSKLRASQLLYSPSILAVFPTAAGTEFIANQNTRAAWNAYNAAGLSSQQIQLGAMDFLLPCTPLHLPKSAAAQASAFPPLGTSGSRVDLSHTARKYNYASLPTWPDPAASAASIDNISVEPEEPESPLIAFLILLLRFRPLDSQNSIERLTAASILTILYRAGLTHNTRETAIGLLAIPLLVRMLDDISPVSRTQDLDNDKTQNLLDWTVKERAPAVLAMLVTDSEFLQKAAIEAGVMSKLSKLLKISYDPVLEDAQVDTWSPQLSDGSDEMDISLNNDPVYPSQPPLLVHRIRVRESTLKAIAALAPFKDEYRKMIVDQGMIPYIVESMNPNPSKPLPPKIGDKSEKPNSTPTEEEPKQGYGKNPVSVLIAACGAIRALSRSVSVLRTTLIDNGVALPVFKLLKHPDFEVQIAATGAVCNLVMDISPMRDTISEAGVLKILCEHAHSGNAKLRVNALWALKHFVHGVSNDMKRTCLEELGQGWLVQLICDDTEDEALLSSKGSDGKPSAAISADTFDEDVEMDQFEDQLETGLSASLGRTNSRPSSSRSKSIQQAEARLALLREAEINPAKKARKDDIAVQEQGLDFIRNLIGGAGQGGQTDCTEMVDFLFNALGQDRVFEILASKLRSKNVGPFSRRSLSGGESRVTIPPQAEIIIAVGYILVHMAASAPRHRQLLIAQKDLLKLLVPQFNHANSEVRTCLCQLVVNLTWVDDELDRKQAAERAQELERLGFLEKLEGLRNTDTELNVRERVKSAIWQMTHGPEQH